MGKTTAAVVLGIIGIFMYVGAEVAVGSVIINFLGQKDIAVLGELEASKYVALYWGGMLIGRFMGTSAALLVMAILGGALLPPLAYGYVAFYGAIGHKVGRKVEA